MKVIKLSINVSKEDILKTKNEGEIFKKYKHPNIVEFFDTLEIKEG